MKQRKVKIGDLVRCTIDNDIGLVIRFGETGGIYAGDPVCLWQEPDRIGQMIYPCGETALVLIEPKEKENA